MKKSKSILSAALCSFAVIVSASSCTDLFFGSKDKKQGEILISFNIESAGLTRAGYSEFPDTNDFILTVSGSDGNILYSGKYGASPETIIADPGSYEVSVRSCEFNEPQFNSPQYGDDRTVVVKSGERSSVLLNCTQLNCGIRLMISDDFRAVYPDGVLFLKSAEGRLMYSISEKRIAYFKPGNVSLVLSDGSDQTVLFTRRLEARQILVMDVDVSSASVSANQGIRISVDTCRVWINDNLLIGGGGSGAGDISGAYSTGEVEAHSGESDVWVYGYIVGGDLSSSKCSFAAPFASRTNFVLASKSSCKDKSLCVSVQLAKGDIRDALNLVDHEEYLGRQIFVKGDIVPAYYGIPGIQNISEYKFK